jgi:Flp pilus assembly protein TadG
MSPARVRAALNDRLRRLAAADDAGSSTAQAVLVTPLLVAVLMFVVLCGRLVSAQIDLQAAASAAARSASIARSEPAARAEADRTARDTLAARGVTCQQVTVTVSTGGLRPGGAVTVTVACTVPLADLALLAVPGSRTVQASATSPVDVWRGTALAITNADLPGRPAASTDPHRRPAFV